MTRLGGSQNLLIYIEFHFDRARGIGRRPTCAFQQDVRRRQCRHEENDTVRDTAARWQYAVQQGRGQETVLLQQGPFFRSRNGGARATTVDIIVVIVMTATT